MVRPRRQWALATALDAEVRVMHADHGAPWEYPRQFASLTAELVLGVVDRSVSSTDNLAS